MQTREPSSQNPSIMPNKLNIVNLVEKIESTPIEDGAQETSTNAPKQYICNSCVISTYYLGEKLDSSLVNMRSDIYNFHMEDISNHLTGFALPEDVTAPISAQIHLHNSIIQL
ncbi:hypothetical protein BD560DRAFT_438952 [Blakeslea trispora]|nr:hypothetical protein BD560DRAFT_438952 [Blakeslea trispora]